MVKNYKEILFYPSIFILQEVHFPNRACSFTVKKTQKNPTLSPSFLYNIWEVSSGFEKWDQCWMWLNLHCFS